MILWHRVIALFGLIGLCALVSIGLWARGGWPLLSGTYFFLFAIWLAYALWMEHVR